MDQLALANEFQQKKIYSKVLMNLMVQFPAMDMQELKLKADLSMLKPVKRKQTSPPESENFDYTDNSPVEVADLL